ncbi:hypothetical protein HPP92_003776 [Vanilla planifolia]|uniref:Uncharacterized protein n=1 Tax=Vanilla planifolia TaxID=51239 RepID=A0A835RV24_VANPL|nr:hypothetical protein HPP92_003776 [Vanilla planifolia]
MPLEKISYGYRLVSIEENPGGGLIGLLRLKQGTSTYGPDIPSLRLFVKHETHNCLRVHITDAVKERWEVPYNLLPREQPPSLQSSDGRIPTSTTPFTAAEYSGIVSSSAIQQTHLVSQ